MQLDYLRLREVAGAIARGEDPRPRLRGLDPASVVACTTQHRLAGLLYARLGSSLDAEMSQIRAQLRRPAMAASLTNARLRRQLEAAVRAFNACGVTPVLLKGAARMWKGERDWELHPSVDLDVLVAPEEIEVARAALLDCGYFEIMPERFARFYEAEHHHTAPLAVEGGVTVEIHRALGPRRLFSLDLTVRGLEGRLIAMERDGMRVRFLDAPAGALHLAVHGVPHASLRDLYFLAALLASMKVDERAAVRMMVQKEAKERERLQAVLYEAAALARIPWPVEENVVRTAEWSLTRATLPSWVQARSQCADGFFSTANGSLRHFIAQALRPPVAEPAMRLVTRHPVRVVTRIAVGSALLAKYGAWKPAQQSARSTARELLRSSESLYKRLRAFKALASTRKPETISTEVAALFKDHPELRDFVDEVRRAHWTVWGAGGRRQRITAALDRLMAGPFLRNYVNAELARAAHDEPLGRLNEYERRIPLFRIPGFALSVSFINVKRASREIASTASNAWFAPLHEGVRIVRYGVPEDLKRGLFSRDAALQPFGTETLAPLQTTAVIRTTQAYTLEAGTHEIVAVVFEATERDPLIWRFDPKTLRCIGVTPSDVKITRIKETLRFIEAMRLRDAAPYVQSIAKHSSHFLRWSAISTLYRLDSPEALPLLRRATRDRHPHVRRAANALLNERNRDGANA